ncbi:hypothetical protein [Haliscomenobacter sp.]|uniref:hypothetical protein n=1 Tax=Haliscomenobacter sp. TaxID=2717303 RepID=UPI003BAA22BF
MTESEAFEQDAENLIEQYHSYWLGLSTSERVLLKDFMNSPMHACNQQVLDLSTYLSTHFKNNKNVKFTNEALIRKYSSGRKAEHLSTHWSKFIEQLKTLIGLIEHFLVYQQVMGEKLVYQRLLVKSLKERKNNDLFLKAATDFRTSLNKSQLTIMVAADKWWLEHQCYYHKYTDHSSAQSIFDRNIAAFDTFNQVTFLRNYLEMLNRNVPNEPLIAQFNLALEHILTTQAKFPTLIELYITLIKILKCTDEIPSPDYFDFKKTFFNGQYELAKVDQLILAKTCSNYLYIVYTQLGSPWLDEVFEWYEYISQKGLYGLDGTTSEDEYMNFYLIALALGKNKELSFFQETYTKMLDQKVKDQVLSLCQTSALQKENKIVEALALLNNTFPLNSKKSLKYDLRAKELRVMLSYDIMLMRQKDGDTVDELERNIDNLKKFCQRLIESNRLSEDRAAQHQNFRIVASKLFLLQSKAKQEEKKAILQDIQKLIDNNAPLSYRSWILKQLATLG